MVVCVRQASDSVPGATFWTELDIDQEKGRRVARASVLREVLVAGYADQSTMAEMRGQESRERVNARIVLGSSGDGVHRGAAASA